MTERSPGGGSTDVVCRTERPCGRCFLPTCPLGALFLASVPSCVGRAPEACCALALQQVKRVLAEEPAGVWAKGFALLCLGGAAAVS